MASAPTLTLDAVTPDTLVVTGSMPGAGLTHLATEWQVTSPSDAVIYHSAVVTSSGALRRLERAGFTPGTTVRVSARYRVQQSGQPAEWTPDSDPLEVTFPALSGPQRVATVELWDGYAAGGGTRIAVLAPLAEGYLRHQPDGADEAVIVLADRDPDDEPPAWLAALRLRRVLRVTDHLGRVTEWRVSRITDGTGEDAGTVAIYGDPPLFELDTCGPIRERTPGGGSKYSLGLVRATPREYIEEFILPTLDEAGLGFFTVGEIESDILLDIQWDGWTPIELLNELARLTGLQRRARRVGDSGYVIDLVENLSPDDTPPVLMQVERNVIGATRDRDAAEVVTVATPQGMTPAGGDERATIADAVWEVVAKAGDTLTLGAPNGGDGPVAFADQFVGAYLEAPDGTRAEVTATDADTQAVTVTDVSAFGVGDHVEFRADASGTHLEDLVNPGGAQEAGRLQRVIVEEAFRGERNYVANPFFSRWEEPWPEVVVGRVDGLHTSASLVSLQDLPPGYEIREGDLLLRYSTTFPTTLVRIQDDAMVDEYGEVTVEVEPNLTVADGYPLYISRQAGRLPEGWSVPSSTATRMHVARRDRALAGVLPCEANGAYSVTSFAAGGYPVLNLRGLAPGEIVQFGDLIRKEGGDTRLVALSRAVADAGGTASVVVRGQLSGQDGDALVIERPDIPADAGPVVWGIEYAQSNPAAITPTLHIPYRADLPVIWFRVGMTFWSPASVTFGVTIGLQRPQLLLFDADSQQSVAQVTYAEDLEVPAATPVSIELRIGYQLTQPRRLQLWVRPPHHDTGGGATPAMNPLTFVRWTMATVGPDEKVPPIDGSHATLLWQYGNQYLVRHAPGTIGTGFRIRLMDLAASSEYVPADEALAVGGRVRFYDRALGEDRVARIETLTVNLVEPEQSAVDLDTRPPALTRLL